jgi:hypothetical protein
MPAAILKTKNKLTLYSSLHENNGLHYAYTVQKLCGNLRKQKVYAWFPFRNFKFTRVYGVWKPKPFLIPGGLRSGIFFKAFFIKKKKPQRKINSLDWNNSNWRTSLLHILKHIENTFETRISYLKTYQFLDYSYSLKRTS